MRGRPRWRHPSGGREVESELACGKQRWGGHSSAALLNGDWEALLDGHHGGGGVGSGPSLAPQEAPSPGSLSTGGRKLHAHRLLCAFLSPRWRTCPLHPTPTQAPSLPPPPIPRLSDGARASPGAAYHYLDLRWPPACIAPPHPPAGSCYAPTASCGGGAGSP